MLNFEIGLYPYTKTSNCYNPPKTKQLMLRFGKKEFWFNTPFKNYYKLDEINEKCKANKYSFSWTHGMCYINWKNKNYCKFTCFHTERFYHAVQNNKTKAWINLKVTKAGSDAYFKNKHIEEQNEYLAIVLYNKSPHNFWIDMKGNIYKSLYAPKFLHYIKPLAYLYAYLFKGLHYDLWLNWDKEIGKGINTYKGGTLGAGMRLKRNETFEMAIKRWQLTKMLEY